MGGAKLGLAARLEKNRDRLGLKVGDQLGSRHRQARLVAWDGRTRARLTAWSGRARAWSGLGFGRRPKRGFSFGRRSCARTAQSVDIGEADAAGWQTRLRLLSV